MPVISRRQKPEALRSDAYPSVGDQLDAIWKILNSLADDGKAPADAAAVREKVKAVKARFPKTTLQKES